MFTSASVPIGKLPAKGETNEDEVLNNCRGTRELVCRSGGGREEGPKELPEDCRVQQKASQEAQEGPGRKHSDSDNPRYCEGIGPTGLPASGRRCGETQARAFGPKCDETPNDC